ncbi:MAG TPA: arginine N-succinyltransferase [Opitutaceae bacterium]|nr:arginine N-succinyltransferase [Opitutaceae bacterium]
MFLFRPIAEKDLSALVALARSIQGSLTTLPADEVFLEDRINDSLRAFSPRVKKAGGEYYLFVLENTETGEIVGTSGLAARVGGFEPFYSYRIAKEIFSHPPLNITREIGVLHLKEVHQGPSEIGALYLRPHYRRGGLGRMLSLSRFLFMATYPKRFDPTVIAELRGYVDQQGKSPFWEAVGRHFFGSDFFAADRLTGLGNKQFIADLMPRNPIYLPLLAPEVQAVIGKVHHETEPALALLKAEGFQETDEVDIFDAGPQLRAKVSDLRVIRAARTLLVEEIVPAVPADSLLLLATPRLDFRATQAGAIEREGQALVDEKTAELLKLRIGDKLLASSIR